VTGQAYTSGERSEITAADLAPATEEVAAALGVELGQMAVRRQRVIYDQVGPVEVATSWFSAQVAEQAPRLLEQSRIRQGTLAYVEQASGRRGRVARDRETARLATPEEAQALQLGDEPAAVLLIHHSTYDEGGEPIEFVEAVYPGGRWTFEDEYPIG
jgi:DNA-binding GntR family transcriptional regulator